LSEWASSRVPSMSITISSGAAPAAHARPRASARAVAMLRRPSEWTESRTRHTRWVRTDPAEQFRLSAQHGDVGQTVAAVSEHHRQLRQHDTRIMRRTSPPGVGHRRRQPGRQPDPVGPVQRAATTRHAMPPPCRHRSLDPLRSASIVHFRSALPLGRLILRKTSLTWQEGLFADRRAQPPSTTEGPGQP